MSGVVSDAILTYVFHALNVVVAAFGGVIWWHVRRLDRMLEKVSDGVAVVREQHAGTVARIAGLENDAAAHSQSAARIDAAIVRHETRITRLEARCDRYEHGGNNSR
ncbi:MAG TPA: hypothetical protein VHI13_11695 [Candidatus Kapabacteria bacterium]|nr:hypothetical protein [Candidatus Kapabacteria bacterium]